MTNNKTLLTAESAKKKSARREQDERAFLDRTFDYFRENSISGDVHEYGCDLRPVLPYAIDAGKTYPVSGMKYFGFGAFVEPRIVPGRKSKTESAFEVFVSQKELEKSTAGGATLIAGPASTILSRSERDRFMNSESKVALVIIHASMGKDATVALEFVEPLLTEGSVVYFADMLSGYRRTAAKEVGRAFLEFQKNCRFEYIRFLDVGWWGRSYTACLPVELPFEKL